MRKYWGKDYYYRQVYRYLGTLYNGRKEEVLKISVEHTRKILGGVITVAFYDGTTLHFKNLKEEKTSGTEIFQGWKGYITNTDINSKDVISQYHGLWVVVKTFRISDGTLEMRLMFHFTERRIEAHVWLYFVALKVRKEFERILKVIEFEISVDKLIDIAKTLSTITIALPNGETVVKTLFLTEEQKLIEPVYATLSV